MSIIDLHCDVLSRLSVSQEGLAKNAGHFDLMRSAASGLALQCFALFHYADDFNVTLRNIMRQIEVFHHQMNLSSNRVRVALTYQDIVEAGRSQCLACLLHMEGADALGDSLELLPLFYRLGVRSIGLTWNHQNAFASGVLEPEDHGLTPLGQQLIQYMDHMGVILDLAHIGERGFAQALDCCSRPVMVSHANARALCPHPRNLSDRQLQALGEHGGLVGVTLVNDFIAEENGTIQRLLDHIAYVSDLIGVEHLALGSDFDGADRMAMTGVEQYAQWPELLSKRGFTDAEIQQILQDNALRLFKAVLNP